MYVVISSEVLDELYKAENSSGSLQGVSVDNGSVVRLLGPIHSQGELKEVGFWHKLPSSFLPANTDEMLEVAQQLLSQHEPLPTNALLALLYAANKAEVATCYFFRLDNDNRLQPQPFEQLALFADYRSRLQGLFDSSLLADCTVGIVGLGTGGSVVAAELAKAGVGNLRLADFDRLKVHNLARHVCGMRDLGRYKTDAMRDYLVNASPIVRVETFNFDITSDELLLEQFLDGCDLLIGAADDEAAKSYLNRAAWKRNIPALYGAAYDRGFGGDVFQALPPEGPCYECFRNATAELFNTEARPQTFDYGKEAAQPALGLDVSFPSLLMARAGLSLLLAQRGEISDDMQPFDANWILWCSQLPAAGWLNFNASFQTSYIDIPVDIYCPVCHTDAYLESALQLRPEQVEAEARKLLDSLPSLPVTH